MFIGRNRSDAINFLQKKLNYSQRYVAEATYFDMLSEGLIEEGDFSVFMEDSSSDEENLNKKSIKSTEKLKAIHRRMMSSIKRKTTRISNKKSTISSINYVGENDSDLKTDDK